MEKQKTSNEKTVSMPAKTKIPSSAFLLVGGFLIIISLAFLVLSALKFNSSDTLSLIWLSLSSLLVLLSSVQYILLLVGRKGYISGLRKFQSLVENSTVPMQVADVDGKTQYVNPAFLDWIKSDWETIKGKNIFEALGISQSDTKTGELWSKAVPSLLSGKAWVGETEFMRPDGSSVFSSVLISPVFNSEGELEECIVLHNDRTELKHYASKIIETQRWYEEIVESSLDGIIIILNKKMNYVNPAAVRMFGYSSAEEMQKMLFSDIIASSDDSFLERAQSGYVASDEILRNHEMRGLTKQGKIIDLEANAHLIDWNNQTAIQASFRDISERKMLEREQSLWLWEQDTLSDIDSKLVGVLDLEKIFSAILQHTLNLTRAHFAGLLLFDDQQEQVQWKSILGNSLQHSLDMFYPNEIMNKILKNKEPLVIHDSEINKLYPVSELSIVAEEKLVSTVWLPLKVEGKQKGNLVVGYRQYHDFAGREMRLLISLAEKHSIAMVNAQLYANLLQREKELEILTGARVKAQEDERRRIAREIHDGLGQMLTAIKFNLELFEDTVSAGKEEKERILDMKALLDDVMKEAREISYNLMPSVLEDFGLIPALQLLGEQFSARTGVKVQYHPHNITERMDPQMEISLYRIVQESLNNVAKHAEASEVNLQVIRHDNGIRLVIEDNGKGMSKEAGRLRATDKGGMGLVSMRERANSLGGVLTIDSSIKSGTLITVEIPLAKPAIPITNAD